MLILSRPAICTLEITAACNNRCRGCSNAYAAERSLPVWPASRWEALLADLVPDAARIRLSGGEPTLHPEFPRIVQAAAAGDAWVSIFTNGRWPDPLSLVRQLSRVRNLAGLLVSLHGASPDGHEAFTCVRGSFEEAVANIRLAVDHGLAVALCAVLTRQNCEEVEALVALGHRVGAQHVAFNRYVGPPRPAIEPSTRQLAAAVARIETLARSGERVRYGECIPYCFVPNSAEGCFAGTAHVSIDPVGNVRPCHHSPTIIGSLQTASLGDLWCGDAMNLWRAQVLPGCLDCVAFADCLGGCRAAGELRQAIGDPLAREPLSEYCPEPRVCELPGESRPRATVRLRPESFGYTVLGHGQYLPVSHGARRVIEACDGTVTFSELAGRFDQEGIELLGELWALGMLDAE